MGKMTIHRALSELKLIDARIDKQTSEILPTGIFQKGKLINGTITEEEFTGQALSRYQSVHDLIDRKAGIKSAVVKANAETMVKVAGKSMTVADAINTKTAIKFKKKLVETLIQRSRQVLAAFNQNNQLVQQNVQKLLEAALGKDAVKTDSKDVDSIRKPYIEANEFHLWDPLKVQTKIEELEKEIAEFESDVDAVLSEANAVTMIEI